MSRSGADGALGRANGGGGGGNRAAALLQLCEPAAASRAAAGAAPHRAVAAGGGWAAGGLAASRLKREGGRREARLCWPAGRAGLRDRRRVRLQGAPWAALFVSQRAGQAPTSPTSNPGCPRRTSCTPPIARQHPDRRKADAHTMLRATARLVPSLLPRAEAALGTRSMGLGGLKGECRRRWGARGAALRCRAASPAHRCPWPAPCRLRRPREGRGGARAVPGCCTAGTGGPALAAAAALPRA